MKRESNSNKCWARTGATCSASIGRFVRRRNVRSCQSSVLISVRAVSARVQGIRMLDSIRGEQ
jgi:hypothetical protein